VFAQNSSWCALVLVVFTPPDFGFHLPGVKARFAPAGATTRGILARAVCMLLIVCYFFYHLINFVPSHNILIVFY
jgi:hypothetical protein